MPRKTTLSDPELRMCQRIAWLRNQHKLTREDWAKVSGMTSGRIVRIELGRVFFLYEDFLQLMTPLLGGDSSLEAMKPVNPFWMYEGREPMRVSWPILLPTTDALGLRFNTGFREFVEQHRELLEAMIYDRERCVLPPKWLRPCFKHHAWLEAKSKKIGGYRDEVWRLWERSFEAAPDGSADKLNAAHDLEAMQTHKSFSEKELTDNSLKRIIPSVKTEIEKLIERVKGKVSKPGAKAELARELGVDPARISEWLSGKKEPGGEYTLKLLNWVEQ